MEKIEVFLTNLEKNKIQKFYNRHEKKHGICQAAAGGRYWYSIYPCGLGTGIVIHCQSCRRKLDITDYESW